MPEAIDPPAVHLLIGGAGSVRFGVALSSIGGVREHAELPDTYRSVNVPGLFDATELDATADRFAHVPAAGDEAHLRLGPDTCVEEVAVGDVAAVPRILGRTAARWSWQGLWLRGPDVVVVVLDPVRLSSLGAPQTREVSR